MKNSNIYLYIGVGALMLSAFIIGGSYYKKSQAENYTFLVKESAEIFVRDYSPRYGNKDAKVFLIEFLDPECESCRMFYPAVKKLITEFDGKVQLVVRYAPFHRNSKVAIRALEAARKQGKYWEAMELLFEHQPKWGSHHNPQPQVIFKLLPQIGLDMDKLNLDMKDPEIGKIIEQDTKDLRQLEVRGTPTFFVNGKPLQRFNFQELRSLIRSEVSEQYKE